MVDETKFKPQKEINRLKAQLKKHEKDRNKLFPGLGQLTYQEFLAGRLNNPALQDLCQQIRSFDSMIEDGNSQIEMLREQAEQMRIGAIQPGLCAYCNTPLSPGVRFCGNCGQELAPSAPPSAEYCPKCASPLIAGYRFCADCGAPVGEEMPAAPAQPPAGVTPLPPPVTAVPPVPPPSATSAGEAGKRCAKCGATVDEKDAAFCGECGAKL